jgi:diacylglycerol kinase family enzyme
VPTLAAGHLFFCRRVRTLFIGNPRSGRAARVIPRAQALAAARGARVDDGLLDLAVLPPASVRPAGPMITRLFTGSFGHAWNVLRLRAERFVVERPAPGLIHSDGETHPAGRRVEFLIRPASRRVLAPAPVTGR